MERQFAGPIVAKETYGLILNKGNITMTNNKSEEKPTTISFMNVDNKILEWNYKTGESKIPGEMKFITGKNNPFGLQKVLFLKTNKTAVIKFTKVSY